MHKCTVEEFIGNNINMGEIKILKRRYYASMV
jgi:hypothetical protein